MKLHFLIYVCEFRPRPLVSKYILFSFHFHLVNLIHFSQTPLKRKIKEKGEEEKETPKGKLGFSKFFKLTIRYEIVSCDPCFNI